MNNQILIIEDDEDSAQIIKDRIESITNMKCTIAFKLPDVKRQLHTNQEITYIFLFYDVSDDVEQLREQTTKTYIVANYPWIQVYSIGSIKKESVTITEKKVFIFNANDIFNLTLIKSQLNKISRLKRMNNFNVAS